jgi:hypothetical protein
LTAALPARAETITFTAKGAVTAAQGAAPSFPVGTSYDLTFTLDWRPPPTSGSGAIAYTREYGLDSYSARLGEQEFRGSGRVWLVHRPLAGRDRVIVRDDGGELLLGLSGSAASRFLAGEWEAPTAPQSLVTPALVSPVAGAFQSVSLGVTGWIDQLTVATVASPPGASTVPLPPAAKTGLLLLAALASLQLRRPRRSRVGAAAV